MHGGEFGGAVRRNEHSASRRHDKQAPFSFYSIEREAQRKSVKRLTANATETCTYPSASASAASGGAASSGAGPVFRRENHKSHCVSGAQMRGVGERACGRMRRTEPFGEHLKTRSTSEREAAARVSEPNDDDERVAKGRCSKRNDRRTTQQHKHTT